jgi:HEAT repeat protein
MEIIKTIGKDAGPELRTLLQDTSLDNSYNYYILYMLGDIADEGSQDLFSSFLEAEDPKLRAVAMRGISKLDSYLPLDKLMAYAEDENPSVRKYLAFALNNYKEPAALTSLTGLLADNNFNVRFAASESLKNKGEQAEKPLLDLINNQGSYPEYASDLAGDLLEEGF